MLMLEPNRLERIFHKRRITSKSNSTDYLPFAHRIFRYADEINKEITPPKSILTLEGSSFDEIVEGYYKDFRDRYNDVRMKVVHLRKSEQEN